MNPYYIRRPDPSENMARLGHLGLQLYGLKQQGELARGQQALSERELGMKGEQLAEQKRVSEIQWGSPERVEAPAMEGGEPSVTPGTEGLEQRKLRLSEEQQGKENADLANFEPMKAARVVQKLKSLGLSEEYPLVKKIKELAWDKNITNYGAYQEIKSLYPQFRQEMGDKVMADFMKKSEANPLYEKSPEGQSQQAFVQALAKDDTGDMLLGAAFADTIAAAQRRQAPTMTAQAQAIKAMQPEKMSMDQLLAQKVQKGEMTLEQALETKQRPEKVQSMGNAVDLAINRKFNDPAFLTDPVKHKQALEWLATDEGRQAVRAAATDVIPPSITYLQTAEGFTPAVTRGPGVGTVGQPTGMGKPLSSEMVVATQQIETLKDALKSVESLYKPAYVGAVAGRVAGLKEKTIGIETNQAKFNSDLAQLKNSLVYLMSGKQINETEYKRLLDQLPDKNLPPSTFEARMENFKRTVDSIIENRKKGMGGYGTQPQPSKGMKIGRFTVEAE